MKGKVKFLTLFSSVFILSLVSCSGSKDWNNAGSSLEVNYCLLQGQLDHNDSIERTRGVRDALGTRDNDDDTLNENVQSPKVNNEFNVETSNGSLTVTVTEKEHATMISTAGATWDSITANDTSTIWLNKHSADKWTDLKGNSKKGQSITMFVSNNDGMAMGAMGSIMWPTGEKQMPIFGFDANENAIEAIKNGKMTGSIDCNSAGQVASCIFMIRNITDYKLKKDETEEARFKDEVAFANITEDYHTSDQPYGYIQNDHILYQSPITEGGKYPRAMLSQGQYVTKRNLPREGETKSDLDRLNDFFNDDGTIKSAVDRITDDEPNLITEKLNEKEYPTRKVFMTYNNETDTYFSATIKPLFAHFSEIYNMEFDNYPGNGSDESKCLDGFETAVNKEGYSAFIINMVKSSNANEYLTKLTSSKSKYYDKVNNKITVPIIFWNKQPTDIKGNVDVEFMNQDVFSFVAYAGIDSRKSGQLQGEMIAQWIRDQYNGINY